MSATQSHKRARPAGPPSERQTKYHRTEAGQESPRQYNGSQMSNYPSRARNQEETFAREQTRRNQIQEAEQMREWVAKEDDFVLKQSKKKAQIRVKEGRAKPIDWLAVTLSVIDKDKDLLEDDVEEEDVEVIDPSGIFQGMDPKQLQDLGKDIETYKSLETNVDNRRYWMALKTICEESQAKAGPTLTHGRSGSSVSADIDRLMGPKNLAELTALERQISGKLESNEPIDVEYWEQLLRSVHVFKARAELKSVYDSVVKSRLEKYRQEQRVEGDNLKRKLDLLLQTTASVDVSTDDGNGTPSIQYSRKLDPEPELKLLPEDKHLETIEETEVIKRYNAERSRVSNLGYVPAKQALPDRLVRHQSPKPLETTADSTSRFAAVPQEDFSSATKALYEREVARGVQEDEEIFAGEEEVLTKSKSQWAGKYRPRKPRYFNRVQMGYEWNKYNQTHYDHDNPPPKVVQGYKFNIFYPDLIDKTKAPTYRIEREDGRKRGESFAPAGEEDTCLIRFISGPPYEDLGFKIVDKEWDFSAKRDRGFKSSFDKGILQLHFQFKKVYYRK